MVYDLVELQRSLLQPAVRLADLARGLCAHPRNPLATTLPARTLAASSEALSRLWRRYEKPRFRIHEVKVEDRTVPIREEVVQRKSFCTLLRFRRVGEPPAPRLLVVAPLSGHFATLLRDTVVTALQDFDVYVTDWEDAKQVPLAAGPFHLDDYVDYVRDFLRLLGPGTHAMAVCQPTVPVLAAAALMAQDADPAAPRSLVLMGGPVDARKSPTEVNRLAERQPFSFFERQLIQRVPVNYPGFRRRVYPGYLQLTSFVLMNPERHAKAHLEFYQQLLRGEADKADSHRAFYDEYNAVLDMAAEYYLDTIRVVFQEYHLATGRMQVHGRPVQPAAIAHTALLTVEGEHDDIAGRGQTEAAQRLCPRIPAGRRAHLLAEGVGHYGVFSGRRFRETIYPRIRDFIRAADA